MSKKDTQFQPGQSGNPAGRTVGARNKLNQLFYDDLYQDWQEHGIQAIEAMRLDSPAKYCQLVATVLPKALELDTKDGVTWVINATPQLTTQQWLEQHGLDVIESPEPVLENDQ